MENLPSVIIILTFFAALSFYYLRNQKKYTLYIIAFLPVINIFWDVYLFDYSVIELVSAVFPMLFIVVLFNRLRLSLPVFGRFSRAYLFVMLSYLVTIIKLLIAGEDAFPTFETAIKVMCGLASYHIFLVSFRPDDNEAIIRYISIGLIITMVLFYFEMFISPEAAWGEHGYEGGLYHDPGNYSRMALIGIIITLPGLNQYRQLTGKFYRYSIIALSIIMLGYAISRNVILSMIGVITIYSLYTRRLIILVMAIAIGTALYTYSSDIQAALKSKTKREMAYLEGKKVDTGQLGSGRIRIWRQAWAGFKSDGIIDKLFGTGYGIGPHGQLFELLRRLGLLGVATHLFLYLSILFYTIARLRESPGQITPLNTLLLTASLFILSFASNPIYNFYYQIILFGFLAMLENEGNRRAAYNRSAANNHVRPGPAPPRLPMTGPPQYRFPMDS